MSGNLSGDITVTHDFRVVRVGWFSAVLEDDEGHRQTIRTGDTLRVTIHGAITPSSLRGGVG